MKKGDKALLSLTFNATATNENGADVKANTEAEGKADLLIALISNAIKECLNIADDVTRKHAKLENGPEDITNAIICDFVKAVAMSSIKTYEAEHCKMAVPQNVKLN